jgi:hypothetical protein
VGELEQLIGVLPVEDGAEGVRAGDEVQLGIGAVLLGDVPQGVDGEGRPGTVHVHPADGEAGVGRGGDHGHQIAVLGRGDLALRLLVRPARGDEDDLVELEVVRHLARGDQVAMMDGIECSSHHSHTSLPLAIGRVHHETDLTRTPYHNLR